MASAQRRETCRLDIVDTQTLEANRRPTWNKASSIEHAGTFIRSMIPQLDAVGKNFRQSTRRGRWFRNTFGVHLLSATGDHGAGVTSTSTDMPKKASLVPMKLPATGIACRISRATATGMRLAPPTLRFVGSNAIQPAPGT